MLIRSDAGALTISAVTETHIHADFVSGSRELAERTGARLYASAQDAALMARGGRGDFFFGDLVFGLGFRMAVCAQLAAVRTMAESLASVASSSRWTATGGGNAANESPVAVCHAGRERWE